MSKINEKDYKEIARTAYKFDPDNYKSEQQIQIGDPIDINGRKSQCHYNNEWSFFGRVYGSLYCLKNGME